jgi:S1-C subfamily serine protease
MKKISKTTFLILAVFSLVSAACIISGAVSSSTEESAEPQATIVEPTEASESNTNQVSVELVSPEELFISLYEESNPGVVAIRVLSADSIGGNALGTGFVIDSEGHLITNYHVVQSASELEIDFPSGFKTRGEIIGTDSDSDIAVIKVDAPPEELFPLPLGDSDQLSVGQSVFAIGNPHGLYGTMTTGIISSLGRTMQSLREAPGGAFFTAGGIIQTDAAINPGNSGGPLLNLNGEVIGVNVAISSSSIDANGQPVNSGIGFTIPINIVKRVVPFLIADGSYDYPYIGIGSPQGGELNLFEQEALGISQSTGVYIINVSPDSPAARAGLQGGDEANSITYPAGGDIIIAIDDAEVRNLNDLISYIILHKSPGDTVLLTIIRDNQEIQVDLTLDRRP